MSNYLKFLPKIKVVTREIELFILLFLAYPVIFPEYSFFSISSVFALAPLVVCIIFRVYATYLSQNRTLTGRNAFLYHPNYLLFVLLTATTVTISLFVNVSHEWSYIGLLIFGICLCDAWIRSQFISRNPQVTTYCFLIFGVLLIIVATQITVWKSYVTIPFLSTSQANNYLDFLPNASIHPNVLSGALLLIIPFCISFVLWIPTTKSLLYRMLFACLLTGFLILLVLTQSRGAYLAFGCSIWTMVFIYYRRYRYLNIVVTAALLYLCFIMIARTYVPEQFRYSIVMIAQERLMIWQSSLEAIKDFPYTGIGAGKFTEVISELYPSLLDMQRYPHAHNIFLQVGLDLGLPGLIIYVALLINLSYMLFRTLSKAHNDDYPFVVASAGSLVGVIFHGLIDAVTWGTKISFLPWLLFALITHYFLKVYPSHTN